MSVESHLTEDKPCVRCGYSLRGLSVGGVCPECGTPVDRSLRGDLLEYCDPHYASGLLTGARLITGSVYSFVILLIALGVGMALSVTYDVKTVPLVRLLELWLLATWGVFVAGWWALTAPDAGQLTTNRGQRPRVVVRVTLLLSSGMILAGVLVSLLDLGGWSAGMLLAVLDLGAVGVGFFASMIYLRWLASRAPSPRVASVAKNLMRTIVILGGVNLLLFTRVDGLIALAAIVTAFVCMGVLATYGNMFSWLCEALRPVCAKHQGFGPMAG